MLDRSGRFSVMPFVISIHMEASSFFAGRNCFPALISKRSVALLAIWSTALPVSSLTSNSFSMLLVYRSELFAIASASWKTCGFSTILETPSIAHCPNRVLMVAVCWYLSCFEIASNTFVRVSAAPSSPFGPVDCISFAICTGSKPSLFHAPTCASVALLPRVMFVNTRFRLVPAFPSSTPIASMVAASAEVVCRSAPAVWPTPPEVFTTFAISAAVVAM